MAARRKREVLDLPALPTGLATNLGQVMIAVLAVATAVFAVVDTTDQSSKTPQTLMALGGTIVTALTLMGGRYAQSCALLKQVPSPVTATASGVVASVHAADAEPSAGASGSALPAVPIVVHCCGCHHHAEERDGATHPR